MEQPQSEFTLGRLLDCTFAQALMLQNRGFEGYYSYKPTTMEKLLAKFTTHGIRPELSVVAFDGALPIGFVWIATKQIGGMQIGRNGGTGVISEYRGKGVAKAMMQEVRRIIDDSNMDQVTLEVVTKNA